MVEQQLKALHGVRPDLSDAQLMESLRQHNFNTNDAALTLTTQEDVHENAQQNRHENANEPNEATQRKEALQCAHQHPIFPTAEEYVLTAMNDAGTNMTRLQKVPSLGMQPDNKTQCFNNVADGNCCPGALLQMLQLLAGKPLARLVRERQQQAALMRDTIFHFQWLNFDRICGLTNQPWHEMITMGHNIGVTRSEMEEYGTWPSSIEGRMEKWLEERSTFYFTTSEIMAFLEMMHAKHIPISIRMWRQNTTTSKLIHLYTCPESSFDTNYVFDMKHTGANDTSDAHYVLLRSGSVAGSKRTVSQSYEDMDYTEKRRKKNGKQTIKRGKTN
jgi:hypothetical protein